MPPDARYFYRCYWCLLRANLSWDILIPRADNRAVGALSVEDGAWADVLMLKHQPTREQSRLKRACMFAEVCVPSLLEHA